MKEWLAAKMLYNDKKIKLHILQILKANNKNFLCYYNVIHKTMYYSELKFHLIW